MAHAGHLHFVPGEDLGWMLELTASRMIAATASRRAELGIDEHTIDRARTLAVTELEGGGQLRRSELLAIWDEAGLVPIAGRGYRLIFHLAQLGVLCFGPYSEGEQRLVLLDEWIRRPRRLDRDEALAEWSLRYFRSHGPATVKDFAWWTKLLMTDIKAGLAIARPSLEHIEVDGVEYFMDPQTPERLAAHSTNAKGVFLLPGFDEFVLGYQDRSAALRTEFAPRVVPGNNGMFMASVVDNGAVVGTWRRQGSGRKATIAATPFTSFTKKVESAIPRLYAALPSPLCGSVSHRARQDAVAKLLHIHTEKVPLTTRQVSNATSIPIHMYW